MLAPVGGEAEDPLGLDVESSGGGGFPEEQLQASLFFGCVSVCVYHMETRALVTSL